VPSTFIFAPKDGGKIDAHEHAVGEEKEENERGQQGSEQPKHKVSTAASDAIFRQNASQQPALAVEPFADCAVEVGLCLAAVGQASETPLGQHFASVLAALNLFLGARAFAGKVLLAPVLDCARLWKRRRRGTATWTRRGQSPRPLLLACAPKDGAQVGQTDGGTTT
jgi:hypothetical protein